ncbi:Glycosyl phosphatidyl inositol protein transamidase complex subunit [Mycoemilia scoparia]|uniref:Glycosyl phosphatidyl inositol protein transamidase complex subunit n=1 Tax=Mycoemilia scoparia TaxID=417184 RepID=A0A9W8A5G7_9FUNG|nr:Glycosyl phosphatidyl inositol protein transamidase complex subunit [Mycoemilia scoparia]
MGLLNLIQGRRAQAALEKADAFLSPFSLLLMLVAIGWLLVFPADVYWRRRYFSENALLESQAKCSFGINNERFELDRIGEILTKVWDANDHNLLTHESNKEIIDKVESLFSGYGLTTETQTFRYKKLPNGEFYQGTNLHGIVHAPRSDHVESIVLCASLKTGNNESNYNAIKLLSSFAYYTTKVNYWAKDVIFLVTDSGEAGVEEWLRSYHERTGYSKDASALKKRAGTIQSALAIELPPTKPAYGYSRMGTFYVSNTGQMPNLDYVNIVTSISRFQGLPSIYNGFDNDESEATFFEKYLKSARWLFGILKAQLIGQPTSIHTPFLKIDAMTLRGIPNTHSHHLGALDTDFTTIGRIIESITRSLNNLLEHFHQSFFFYLLPALNWYIPIGDYMPVIGLMSASLLFQASMRMPIGKKIINSLAMGLWVSLRKNMYSITDMKKRIEYQSSAYNQLRSTIPGAIKTILLFHSIGLGVYVAYLGGSFIPKAFDTTALLLTVAYSDFSDRKATMGG